jgi:FkbM family methyltransferase
MLQRRSLRALAALCAAACVLLHLLRPGGGADAASGLRAPPPAAHAFDPRAWPAIVINHPNATAWRKWSEAQLAGLGYTTYTRIDGRIVPDALRSCADCWQDGLTLAHVAAWERAAAHAPPRGAPPPRGFLILEDDVVFHGDFLRAWPRYDAALRAAPLSVLYVGQWSHAEDRPGSPRPALVEDLSDAAAPWTTHAYAVSPAAAALLARFVRFVFARGGSPLRAERFVFEEYLAGAPWQLGAADTKVDFLMRTAHHYFFRGGAAAPLPQWRALRSTRALPAALGASHRWTQHAGVALAAGAGACAVGAPGFVACEAPGAREAPCGAPSGRLPIMGTGLAYQNQCKADPFMLRVWTGEAALSRAPTCAELRARIAPDAASDPAPPCEDALLFAAGGDGAALPWPAFLARHGAALGSAAGAPVAVRVQALPCACGGGGGGGGPPPACVGCCSCDAAVWLRPGTTDADVLGQVVAAARYGFLAALNLPPPAAVLDAGANCGVAALALGALFPAASIVAVEAEAANFAALLKNVEGRPRVRALQGALWGLPGARLRVRAGSRHGREWDHQVSAGGGGGSAVRAFTVRELAGLLPPRGGATAFDLVKVDVEGAERSVFDRAGGADVGWLAGVALLAVEVHEDVAPGARAAVEDALASVGGAWCHLRSGQLDVWVNEGAPLTSAACAARRARGGSCCAPAAGL